MPVRSRTPQPSSALLGACAAMATIGAAIMLLSKRSPTLGLSPRARHGHTVRAARRMNRAAGLLAASVLADSALEHYRGAFHNKAMVAPLVSAGLSLAVSVHGHLDRSALPHRGRDTVYLLALLTGLAGTGFHLYNVSRKPGGWCWENLFYGAPLGAPAALLLCGGTGFLAERLRNAPRIGAPRILGLPAGRVIAAATAAGLLGTVAEAGLLHFRGAYNDPFMFAPVTVPPLSALLVARAAATHSPRPHRFTRWMLRLTTFLGLAGVAFHARGVSRSMHGWHNLRQNVLNGPPIPAPPSFTGLALAALAALDLMEQQPRD